MTDRSYSSILIVCAANTCRSVIAHWVLRKFLDERGLSHVAVASAGIAPFARDGSLVSLEARMVLREEGIELPDSATSVALKTHPELVADADLILAMTGEQKVLVEAMAAAQGKEVATFREFAGESGDIGDPFAQGDEAYRRCMTDIRRCAAKIAARLANCAGATQMGRIFSWQPLESKVVYRCRLFSVVESRERFCRDRSEHEFYRLELEDWVNIIPLTREDRVVMVRQYRHGIGGFTLEIPGGLIDPQDNSPLVAARREMVEETGYDSDLIEPLGFVHPNPALQCNRCYNFVARGAKRVGTPLVGATEETEVELVALADVPSLIREGTITHALVIAAFQSLAAQRERKR